MSFRQRDPSLDMRSTVFMIMMLAVCAQAAKTPHGVAPRVMGGAYGSRLKGGPMITGCGIYDRCMCRKAPASM